LQENNTNTPATAAATTANQFRCEIENMDLHKPHHPPQNLHNFSICLNPAPSLPSPMRAPGKVQEEDLEEEWLSEEGSEDENEENDKIRVEWRITPFAFHLHHHNNVPTKATHQAKQQQRKSGVWAKRLAELQAFHHTHGHCNAPKQQRGGLGAWVCYVRRRRRLGSLAADQIRQLDELGFNWGGSPTPTPQPTSTCANALPVAVTLVDSDAAPARPGGGLLTNPGGMEQEDAGGGGGGGGGGEVVNELEDCDKENEGEEEEEEGGENGGEEEEGETRGRSARMDENLFAGRVYQLRKFRRKHGHFRLGRSECVPPPQILEFSYFFLKKMKTWLFKLPFYYLI
jgi:hypothetical protein